MTCRTRLNGLTKGLPLVIELALIHCTEARAVCASVRGSGWTPSSLIKEFFMKFSTAKIRTGVAAAALLTISCANLVHARDSTRACQALAHLTIASSKLSLPTKGATIGSAVLIPSSDPQNANGEYCKVSGKINSVDATAPNIGFQVNLPTRWNGKALQFGGAGYNGSIPNTLNVALHGRVDKPTPLALGYVTLASDSGHQGTDNDASFAINDEALTNYAGQHIKKTHDVAAVLVRLRYGAAIKKMYFAGGSTGGREALTAAMRWPGTYDGIVSHYPTANFLGLRLWGLALGHSIYDNGSAGWIPPALVNKIATDSLAACDALDGVADGLVSNMAACRAKSGALLESLTCKNGETDYPAQCLTAGQLKTISTYHDGYTLPYAFANNIAKYEGYNSLEGVSMQIGTQSTYIEPPPSGPNAHHVSRADQFVKNFLTRDPNFRLLTLDLQSPGAWQSRIASLSQAIDATNPDLSAFKARGGKLLLLHGLDDPGVSPYANARLYQSIVERMGKSEADSFSRFYMVPGLAHGNGKFNVTWDSLEILDNWAANGVVPVTPIGIDANKTTQGRSRPICEFPNWPKYKGSGSVDVATNFVCVAS